MTSRRGKALRDLVGAVIVCWPSFILCTWLLSLTYFLRLTTNWKSHRFYRRVSVPLEHGLPRISPYSWQLSKTDVLWANLGKGKDINWMFVTKVTMLCPWHDRNTLRSLRCRSVCVCACGHAYICLCVYVRECAPLFLFFTVTLVCRGTRSHSVCLCFVTSTYHWNRITGCSPVGLSLSQLDCRIKTPRNLMISHDIYKVVLMWCFCEHGSQATLQTFCLKMFCPSDRGKKRHERPYCFCVCMSVCFQKV